tara:strand:- start:1182 stop:2051 length:870 start_codon:yes stop_codon:yes gene_type:complete
LTRDILKYDFKEGLPQEFEILQMKQLYAEFKAEITEPHRAEFYQVLWFQKGTSVHYVDFKPIVIQPNTVILVNKNSVQQFDSKVPVEGKVILFTDHFFCKEESDVHFLKSSILFNDLFETPHIAIPNITSIFSGLITVLETEIDQQKDEYQADVLRNYLRNFLLLLERERRKQDFTEIKKGPDLDYVMLFKELLENQFHHEKQVNSYAVQMHITKKRLNFATSKVLGLTPKKIIDDRIMLEAKRLLAHSSASVKEISFTLGFDEPTNFVKYFRKNHLSTPLEFRDSFLS